MKIINLQAENIKCLTAVEINPDGNVVVISGANGAGKSSVLDSIYWALAGAKGIQDEPIRQGENQARIRLDLGEIIVTRKFSPSGTELVVTSADGARFPSPQKMLDELVGSITFDPLEFSRMKPAEQVDVLRGLVALDVDFADVELQNKLDYNRRTDINRTVKELEATIAANTESVAGITGTEKLNLAELAEKYSNAKESISQHKTLRTEVRRTECAAAECEDKIEELRTELANQERRLKALKNALPSLRERCNAITPPTPEKLQIMQEYITKAESHNAKIDLKATLAAQQTELENQRNASAELTARMEKRTTDAQAAVAAARMPVDGLSLTAEGVTFNGLPFDQINDAEKLRVSVAVAMASNPKLRVLRIENGSLMDVDNMALLEEMANDHDFQIWVERVGAEAMSVVIADGAVANAD